MSQIWAIFKQMLEKYPWRRLWRRPQGAAAPWARGIFKICLKMDHIWLILFSKSPFGYFFISPFDRERKLLGIRSTMTLRDIRVNGLPKLGKGHCRPIGNSVFKMRAILYFSQTSGCMRRVISALASLEFH